MSAEWTILQLLAERPLLGQELVDVSEGKLERGTLYVRLNRLEERGLVRSEVEFRPIDFLSLPEVSPRRRYWLTDDGRKALRSRKERRTFDRVNAIGDVLSLLLVLVGIGLILAKGCGT